MALANYSDLQASVATWLNRTDLTDQIPTFIQLAESRLNRTLRLRKMEVQATLSLASGARTVALPSGYIEPIALWYQTDADRRQLRYLVPTQLEVKTDAGQVYYWTITGSNIEFERPSNQTLSMTFRYLEGFALSDDDDTNWLLTEHPDAYLFSALVEAAPYLRDDDLLTIWESRLQRALAEINEKEARTKGLSTLSTDLPRARWRWDWLSGLQ